MTQCYLLHDTSEHTPPYPHPCRPVLDLPTPEGWKGKCCALHGNPISEGWVDLVDLIAPRPEVKPATFRSRVRRRTAASHDLLDVYCCRKINYEEKTLRMNSQSKIGELTYSQDTQIQDITLRNIYFCDKGIGLYGAQWGLGKSCGSFCVIGCSLLLASPITLLVPAQSSAHQIA